MYLAKLNNMLEHKNTMTIVTDFNQIFLNWKRNAKGTIRIDKRPPSTTRM